MQGLFNNKKLILNLNVQIGDWGLGIGPNPQSPKLNLILYITVLNFIYIKPK